MSWRAGDVAQEKLRYAIVSPQNSEAYRVRIGLFDLATGDRLQVQAPSAGPGFTLTDDGTAVLTPETIFHVAK
jgi:hypothetical protein